jgi:hypothetical protein
MAALQFPDKDRFGLPTRFGSLDPEEETARRELGVKNLVEEVFATAVSHLGEEDAQTLFKKVAARRAGKPRGSTSLERDHYLLNEYDTKIEAGEPPSTLPRLIAEQAKKAQPTKFAATAESIARQLRRLVAAREKTRADAQADFEEWRESYKARFGEFPSSLLEAHNEAKVDK